MSFDLIIKNGRVYDGLGSPPRRADIGIRNGRIAAIAPSLSAPGAEVRDAAGLWVLPGFVDIHTHYDLELEIAPGLTESLRHGVTSVVIGNCSLSVAIGAPTMLAEMFERVETLPRPLIRKWLAASVDWKTTRQYLAHLRAHPIAPNVAALFGHSALRAHVMGLERSLHEKATMEERDEMRRLARESLEAGFIGISVDMVPWHMMSGAHRGRTIPSQHADFEEIRLLADVCREYDAVFQVTPNPQRLFSLLEILRCAHGLGRRPLRATILAALDSVADRRLWRVFAPMLFVLNRLLGCNIRFQTLCEPFTVYSDGPITPLFEEFPAGVRLNDCDTREERQRLWQDAAFRAQFRDEWLRGWRKTFHRRLDLMEIVRCPEASLIGKTFAEAAAQADCAPIDFFMNSLAAHDTELRWVSTGANDRARQREALMSHPFILPGFTDAGAHVQHLGYYDGALSLLKQAMQTGFLPMERAIARVTGEAARWFRIDAGVLRVGAKADIVLLEPAGLHAPLSPQIEIDDPTLEGAPRLVRRGSEEIVKAVYAQGRLVIEAGEVMPMVGKESLSEVLRLHGPVDIEKHERWKQRNRISRDVPDHPFVDYWDVFVLKHRHPWNIALHVLGGIVFYAVLAAAWMRGNPWLLLALPLSQLTGLAGHYFFERSHIDLQDAVFSFRASRCLNRMFYQLLRGQYGEELRRKEAILRTATHAALDRSQL